MDRVVDKCHTSEENREILWITLRISRFGLTQQERVGQCDFTPSGTAQSESEGNATWKRLESSSRPLAHSPECAEGLVSLPTKTG